MKYLIVSFYLKVVIYVIYFFVRSFLLVNQPGFFSFAGGCKVTDVKGRGDNGEIIDFIVKEGKEGLFEFGLVFISSDAVFVASSFASRGSSKSSFTSWEANIGQGCGSPKRFPLRG